MKWGLERSECFVLEKDGARAPFSPVGSWAYPAVKLDGGGGLVSGVNRHTQSSQNPTAPFRAGGDLDIPARWSRHAEPCSLAAQGTDGHQQLMQALMRPTDVARHLGVSRSWLYDAAKAGRIPSIRIGGEAGPLRFVPEDIERWIEDARTSWRPGRPAVATRTPKTVGSRAQGSRRTAAGEQRSLLD